LPSPIQSVNGHDRPSIYVFHFITIRLCLNVFDRYSAAAAAAAGAVNKPNKKKLEWD
jgi:hypothetical protein